MHLSKSKYYYIDVKIGDLYKLGIEQEVLIVTS